MIFFVNQAMGMGNSGVEHAQFYRAKLFRRLNRPFKLLFTDLIEEQHEAMTRWGLAEAEVINMWEYFVYGKDYAIHGISQQAAKQVQTVSDSTNTTRMITTRTASGLRIVRYFVKFPDPKHEGSLLVSVNRVEIFREADQERMASYEILTIHGRVQIRNIHLYHQTDADAHLFFSNAVKLERYFFEQMVALFGANSSFIIDRGEDAESALMASPLGQTKLVGMVHADHLADRQDPEHPLWNNYYEYELDHLDRLDALVVATKLQRNDLLKDFPNSSQKIYAIPVGGVPDEINFEERSSFEQPFRLITMSRLATEKHIDLVIKAVVALHEQGTLITLDIYGGGGEKGKLEGLIQDNHAETYILMKGQTAHPEAAYLNHDAFISASYSEGFGLTYIEALAAGLPVVAFDARFGATELFTDEKMGVLQPFKRDDDDYNVQQLIAGIRRIKTTSLSELQANIKQGLGAYTDQTIAKQWEELLNEL